MKRSVEILVARRERERREAEESRSAQGKAEATEAAWVARTAARRVAKKSAGVGKSRK